MKMIIENGNNDSDDNSDNNDNNNSDNDENNDNDHNDNINENNLRVYSHHKGPMMLNFDVTFVESKTTVEFPVTWDAMSLT